MILSYTHRRWLFQMLKTIKAMATTIPHTAMVLMLTNSHNDTVRSTRLTIVRSCGICNNHIKFQNRNFHLNFNFVCTGLYWTHQTFQSVFSCNWLKLYFSPINWFASDFIPLYCKSVKSAIIPKRYKINGELIKRGYVISQIDEIYDVRMFECKILHSNGILDFFKRKMQYVHSVS